ncbi:MAG: carbamoyltransferase [Gemmatimonadaceae bacterium]|nr:carbamoyltransferase [Gemmatimonadaceae bacterium]
MNILGISAFYHDSAAALVRDGHALAAAQEERFSRRRHDASFPTEAIRYCLAEGRLALRDVDLVVFYEKPFLKFERLLETYLAEAPRGFRSFSAAMPLWLRGKLFQRRLLEEELARIDPSADVRHKLRFSEHHLSHAASAFYPSPFRRAAVLTLDGVGEWTTTSTAIGDGNRITLGRELRFPHSLGLLYSAFTQYTGFRVNSGEYKVMGLAPYGEPRHAQRILDNLIDLKADGSFRLDLRYFEYTRGLTMTNERFHALFDGPPRRPDEPILARHKDLAASIQRVTDEVVLRMTRALAVESGCENLCLAGGVALNCVSNGHVLRDGRFRRIWIQPAAGDAGGALGAALAAHHLHLGASRASDDAADTMRGAFLGPGFTEDEIEQRLAALGARFERLEDEALLRTVAVDLSRGMAVGWFQGRMEFGPRALGARSILGDARNPAMQRQLNLKVKRRESFRPFAPAVLAEDAREWFDLDVASPYMMLVAPVAAAHHSEGGGQGIPAVTHVDHSARVQTVHRETNARFHALLTEFKSRTGCGVLVNTSFNVRGEPIVCTPEDAYRCFMGTDIERLAIGNCLLRKEDQPATLASAEPRTFAPD